MQAHLMLKYLDEENEIPIMIYFGLAHRAGTNSISMKSKCVSAKLQFKVHSSFNALHRGKDGESVILLHMMRIICDIYVQM